jgi:hypothetical protein
MEPDSKQTQHKDELPSVLFFALAIISGIVSSCYFWRYSIISNDDAFIYFTMVRNIIDGYGPVVNPGDTHSPATSLVWVYWLSFLQWCFPAVSITFIAKSASTAFLFMASIFWCYVFKKPARELALAAPFAISSILLFRLCPGMDIALSLFVYSIIFFFYFRDKYEYAAALCGFSFFCRGESIIIIAPLILHYLYQAYSAKQLKQSLPQFVRSAICFVSMICIGVLLQKICLDTPYPSTFKVKIIQGLGGWLTYYEYLPTYIYESIGYHWYDLWYVAVGLFVLGWPGLVLICAAILHAFCFAVMSIAAYNWYSWILQASLRFFAFLGAAKLVEWGVRFCAWLINLFIPINAPKYIVRLLGVVLGIWICMGHFYWYIEYASRHEDQSVIDLELTRAYFDFVDTLNSQRNRFDENVKPIVLTEEIGVLSYKLKGYEIRDINGLASPGLTRENLIDWAYWINKYEPEFLVKLGRNERAVWYFEGESDYKPAIYTYKLIRYDPDRPVGLYQRDHSYERIIEYDNLRLLMSSRTPNTLEPLIDSRHPGVPTLFIMPQSEFVVPAPTVSSQFSMEVGLRSVNGNEVMNSDGVTFHIVGKHKDGQSVVYSQTPVAPVATEVNPTGSSKLIQFQFEKGAVKEFRIIVDPNPKGPAYDWPFISNFIFR